MPIRVSIIGDYDAAHPLHRVTGEALEHGATGRDTAVEYVWIGTEALAAGDRAVLTSSDAAIVAPGSPYRSLAGALSAIRWLRENRIPCLGTCGGFQHMVLELARNVLGRADAAHAEYDPYASDLFVSRMTCSIAGKTLDVSLAPGSIAAGAYGASTATESYYCNFALAPGEASSLAGAGLETTGTDESGESRIVELHDHPFFVGTLFVPQAKSRPEAPHPLIEALLAAASGEVP